MFTQSRTFTISSRNNDIIYAIITNNLVKLKSLLNENNINNVIDNKNNYNALHYAVTLPNNDITEYILKLGGNPELTQIDGHNSFELSLRSGKKFIFEYYDNINQDKIKELKKDNIRLTNNIDDIKKTNDYLSSSVDIYNKKINSLNTNIEIKNKEIVKLKRNLEETEKNLEDSERAFSNLLKKQKNNIIK